ncbi:hypothetical protein GCM10010124_07870 [Pilimelia terevasa]|uniref:GCN5-related N-acetyltransferase Rv2170-like domain-containing protein n=1 Tax=Pilimelia terevasa TaxID=53372 RepID=A0A8J3BFK3_9ACTN|nr:GNAT family N-acetyltransferase [Pilimelia terevasa]GGK17736.1 hypothetical protein GCM10010124_07870 [Pilimelia terevasa]
MPLRLLHHLAGWLGQWPPLAPLQVVGSGRRAAPGWDGRIHPLLGVACPDGLILSVPPGVAALVRRETRDAKVCDLPPELPRLVGCPGHRLAHGVFRWTTAPAALPDAGRWLAADDPAVPAWLAVFGREVLVARDPDTGAHLAGVGVKRHTADGHELAVRTAPRARGRGLAGRLVAQAARRSLDEGAVPTLVHDPGDAAGARVADAAGFADRGWRYCGLSESVR